MNRTIKTIGMLMMISLAMLATGCRHHDENEEHHDHGQELTIYTNTLELFAEINPFMAGQECSVLAHLTTLSNFKPLDTTQVDMIVTVGGKETCVTIKKPEEAGKYKFVFTPKEAGTGTLAFRVHWKDSVETFPARHIHVFKDEEEMERHEEMGEEAEHDCCGHQHQHSHADGECSHEHSHADGECSHQHNHADGECSHQHSHADGECSHQHNHANGKSSHQHSHAEAHGHSHSHSHGHSHDHGHDHGHSHGESEADATSMVSFTKEQSWRIDFATRELQPVAFGQVIKTTAQVLPSQGDERQVSAKASGVAVISPNVVDGASVKAGQVMFRIESSGMADNNLSVRYQEALSDYTAAKQDYERKQKLAADKIVSQSELERSRNAMERAEAAYNNLKHNFASGTQSVSAPITGYVKELSIRNGAYVEAGQPLATVSQNRDLYVRAEVQSRYYSYLPHIVGANIEIDNEVYSLESLGGSLVSYGRSTDFNNPLIPVTFRFRNQVNLLSGSFVTLYIRTQSEQKVIAVENSGIVEEMGSKFVFVQVNPERFEKRAVVTGATDGALTEVKSGLKAGERVVTKGARMVKLAQASGALDPHAGHHH